MKIKFTLSLISLVLSSHAHAILQLGQMALLLEQDKEQVEITVSNNEDSPFVLATKFADSDSGKGNVFFTPSVIRLEPKQKQIVRFIFPKDEQLENEELRIVSFSSIPKSSGSSSINFVVNQEIPLFLHPAGLPVNNNPWELLKALKENGKIKILNNTKYIVRLLPEITGKPSGKSVDLKSGYIMPNDIISLDLPISDNILTLSPKSLTGFVQKEKHHIPIE